jgi:ribosomal protein S21
MYNKAMIQVIRKDSKEALENLIRRFNRKVQQSGNLAKAKGQMRFSKEESKTERRKSAIIRRQRKEAKIKRIRLGLR